MTKPKFNLQGFRLAVAFREARAHAKALRHGREELFSTVDEEMREFRQNVLLYLANVENLDSPKIARMMAQFEVKSSAMIANAQADLRSIWTRSMPALDKQRIVDAWTDAATKQAGLHAWLGAGRLEFDYASFPGQFIEAILENWWRFEVCANPECPARYFLARRSTQRYCERGECTRFAQRRHALTWWRTKGKFRKGTGGTQ
jgi:hypothetical protein